MLQQTNSINVVSLSPTQAGVLLEYRYVHDRPLRPRYVDELVKEMQAGRFQHTAEVHMAYVNGQPSMLNGKHTCHAIVKFGKPVNVTLRKTYTTAGQLAALYALGHDNQLRRLFSDQMGAYGLVEETGLTRSQLDSLSAALKAIRHNFKLRHAGRGENELSPVEMMTVVREWSEFMMQLDNHITPCNKMTLRALRSKSVLPIGLITVRYQPDKACDFWSAIARPDELKYADSRSQARRIVDGLPDLRSTKSELEKVPGKIARCWNAFFQGRLLEVVQPFSDGATIVIAGTPWNGKHPIGMLPNNLAAYDNR